MYGKYDDNNNNGGFGSNDSIESEVHSEQQQDAAPKKWAWEAEKKYFGMTVPQLGILAALIVVLLITIVCGSWLVLSGALSRAQGDGLPTPTLTIQPTVTPLLYIEGTPTPQPTPTFIPVPYEQLIPSDWKQYKTSLIEIWMPANFKLGDKKLKDSLSSTGNLDLLVVETASRSSAYNMIMSVSFVVKTDPAQTMDEWIDIQTQSLINNQIRISDRRSTHINSREVQRLILEYKCNGIDCNSVVYLLLDGQTIWRIEYIAEITEFFTNLPIFEQSVQTFRVVGY